MKRKLIIIGLDGGTYKVIDPLISKGKLPNLEKLIKSGVRGTLRSTYPPITAAAWVSFMTGKNPGNHGLFDFREYNPKDYTPSFIPRAKDSVKEDVSTLHSSRFHGETIWDILSDEGYEMNVIAVPMTYPPWKINGRMVSGYPCPDYEKAKTYPPEWSEEVGQLFNMSAIDYSKIAPFIKECKDLVRRKGRILLNQLKNKSGEVFSVVFSSTDFAQHYFWKYIEQKDHSYSNVVEEVYQEVDDVVGEVLDYVDENTTVVIMSDHGFMSHPAKHFYLNSWLRREGYICQKQNSSLSGKNVTSKAYSLLSRAVFKSANLKMAVKERISKMPLFVQDWISKKYFKSDLIDWSNTKAFRFRMYANVEGIVINQRDRQKNGIVEKGPEYEKLRDEIINKLQSLKDPNNGESVVVAAYKREELYSGNFLENAPDIIVRLNSDYIGGVELDKDIIGKVPEETKNVFTGIHGIDGIFAMSGPGIKKDVEIAPINIIDITPTILFDLSLPIPDDMDGSIANEVFSDTTPDKKPIYVSRAKQQSGDQENLSEDDEEEMKKALKGLGYLS